MLFALVLCGLKGGGLWSQLGLFVGVYVGGACMFRFLEWKLGGAREDHEEFEIEYRDTRFTLFIFGFAGLLFGSPEDCLLLGGVLSVGAIAAIVADYWALAAVSRQRGCSLVKAFWLLLPRPPRGRRGQ